MATKRELNSTFETYFQQRIAKENAITPGQKKALINKLRQELQKQGRIPLPTGPVRVDTKHKVVRAALEGRSVTMSGKIIKKEENQTFSERMESLPTPAKIAVMAGMVFLPCIIATILYSILDTQPEPVAVLPTKTTTPTQTHTPNPSPSPSLTPTTEPIIPSPTIVNTPTPTDFIINNNDIPSKNNQPASIEIAGLSYVLGTGQIKNGIWQPQAAEWLNGSDLRRVIAIPYDHQTVNTLTNIPPGTVAKLRLRSGEVVKYKIAETYRVQRQQIEILAEKKPSVAIILSGEPGILRTIIIGNAIQEPQDFTIYSVVSNQGNPIVITGINKKDPNYTPTPVIITDVIITDTTTSITNTTTITNSYTITE